MQGNQRWRERRSLFRRPDEQIRAREYEVVQLPDDRLTKPFVVRHHYSQSMPAVRFRFGLYDRTGLVGAAVFSHPVNDRTLTSVFGGPATESVELGRFVLLDSVPGNGETWTLARCLHVLRKVGLRGVVSFSDPVPRQTASGEAVFPGHVGTIYQAGNATYLGRGSPRTLRLLPDGRVLSERALQKIRAREQGWEYAASLLVQHGADPLGSGDDGRAWLARWLPRLSRPIRHPGNHKYVWYFAGHERAFSLPYPKRGVA